MNSSAQQTIHVTMMFLCQYLNATWMFRSYFFITYTLMSHAPSFRIVIDLEILLLHGARTTTY